MSYPADFLNICCDVLYEGNDVLGTDLGVVARVEGGVYEVVAVVPPTGLFQPGDTYPVEETFCQEVCESRKIIVLTEQDGQPGLRRHPAYRSFGAEFFVGVPILLDQELWGTVAFSSRSVRAEPFPDPAMRILTAGAAEIAAAHHRSGGGVGRDVRPATEPARPQDFEEPVREEEDLPEGVIPLPLPAGRPRVPAEHA